MTIEELVQKDQEVTKKLDCPGCSRYAICFEQGDPCEEYLKGLVGEDNEDD